MGELMLANHVVLPALRVGLLLVPKCGASSVRLSVEASGVSHRAKQAAIPAGYHRIAIVRNTWDRIVSCWYQKTRDAKRLVHLQDDRFYMGMTLSKFVRLVAENPRANHHFYPQDKIVCPYDELWMLDDLNQRWAARFPDITLRHLNASGRSYYAYYYNDETRRLVAKAYASEIEHFGFAF